MPSRSLLVGLLLALPLTAIAQTNAGPAAAQPVPSTLTDDQWDRLLDRLDGTWRLNLEKSTYFGDDRPTRPTQHIYVKDTKRRGITYKSTDGESFQALDGKPYPAQLRTIARWPADEFTLETITTRGGRLASHETQFLWPNGKAKIIIGRTFNERGEPTPANVRFFEKVPDHADVNQLESALQNPRWMPFTR